jgi:hypothetical protein
MKEIKCFNPEIIFTDQQPVGFEAWTEDIKYDKFEVILPDNSTTDGRVWMNHQGTFDSGSYTTFLVNRYNETLE